MVSSVKSAVILLPFLTIALHESGTRKTISCSVTVYNKNLFSQCNLTAQIKPVQDKNIIMISYNSSLYLGSFVITVHLYHYISGWFQ